MSNDFVHAQQNYISAHRGGAEGKPSKSASVRATGEVQRYMVDAIEYRNMAHAAGPAAQLETFLATEEASRCSGHGGR
jgi:hypothetical protein